MRIELTTFSLPCAPAGRIRVKSGQMAGVPVGPRRCRSGTLGYGLGYASVGEVVQPDVDAEHDQSTRSRVGWVLGDEEMETSNCLPGKRDPATRTMRNANLVPDRIVLRQSVEHRAEVVATEVGDALRRDLGFDVVERRVPEPDRPHERRVVRSAAARSSSGVRRSKASTAPGGSSSPGP